MRIIVQHGDRNLIDLGIWTRRKTAVVLAEPDRPGPDPGSTVAAQIEQADEPAPGFGFRGAVKTVVAAVDNIRRAEGTG